MCSGAIELLTDIYGYCGCAWVCCVSSMLRVGGWVGERVVLGNSGAIYAVQVYNTGQSS